MIILSDVQLKYLLKYLELLPLGRTWSDAHSRAKLHTQLRDAFQNSKGGAMTQLDLGPDHLKLVFEVCEAVVLGGRVPMSEAIHLYNLHTSQQTN